jgi:hypothetical protein
VLGIADTKVSNLLNTLAEVIEPDAGDLTTAPAPPAAADADNAGKKPAN